jgi:transcription-repair coupling factor (superfamily II helicase)
LRVARLRACCHRLGITEVQITSDQAKLSPIHLKLSSATRLKRLSKNARYREETGQLIIPILRGLGKVPEPAAMLVDLLNELVPPRPTPPKALWGPDLADGAG